MVRYKKSEVSAAQIVQAAIRVLARQGYANTSLLEIAKEAGMSKGAVHYHYPTKETLLQVVLQTALDTVQARTIEAWSLGDSPFISLRHSLETLWEVRAERTDEALVVADLLALSLYDERLRPQLAQYYVRAADQIRDYLEPNMLDLGIESKISMKILPRMLLGLLDGLVMQSFVEPNSLTAEEVVNAIETLALSLLQQKGPLPKTPNKSDD